MLFNQVILGDSLDIMKSLPDKSIDLVLTDPPYGTKQNAFRATSRTKLAKTVNYGNFHWDIKLSKEYCEEILRVSKTQIIFGGNYYADWLPPSSCWLVWDKVNGESNFADCELAWTSFDTAVRKYTFMWNGMLQENMKNKEVRFHPTQKPVMLLTKIIQDYTDEGWTILDPFAGSGSTGIACIKTNRNYILIEKEPAYVEIINKRIKNELDQFKLAI
jgi:site-specific DNA-methyltransferase (adenine-specific)